jgi:soluble lytic murein transglycosylase
LLGEGEPALAALDQYVKLAGKGGGGADAQRRAQYFRARALGMLGRQGQADDLLRDLAGRLPFNYYGLLARARLRERGAAAKLDLPPFSGRLPAPDPGKDNLIARADDLAAAGMETEAGIELYRGDAGVMSRLGRERALAVLFDRYPRYRQWRRPYQLADVYGSAALDAEPRGAARLFWEASYPRAYPDLVDRYGPPAGNPEFFLLSIIRKESAYLPTETSYADARGLVQLIPPTAATMAKELGLPFSPDQLYVPEVSVQLGAHYLGALARKFKGNVALAAGAYNAGSRPMMRWCDRNGKRPLDEFVELVTYEQSRLYMKLVLEIYARYRYLYENRPWEPAMALAGCQYEPGGPAD